MEIQGTQNSQIILQRTKLKDSHFLISKLSKKTVWYWHMERHTDQQTKLRVHRPSPLQSVNSQKVPRPFNGGRKLFSTNGAGTTNIHMQQNKDGLCPTLYIKINSKWIKHLNMGHLGGSVGGACNS